MTSSALVLARFVALAAPVLATLPNDLACTVMCTVHDSALESVAHWNDMGECDTACSALTGIDMPFTTLVMLGDAEWLATREHSDMEPLSPAHQQIAEERARVSRILPDNGLDMLDDANADKVVAMIAASDLENMLSDGFWLSVDESGRESSVAVTGSVAHVVVGSARAEVSLEDARRLLAYLTEALR